MNEITQLKKLTESLDSIAEGTDPAVGKAVEFLDNWSMDDSSIELMRYFKTLAQKYSSPFTKELRKFIRVASADDSADLFNGFIEITNAFGGNIEVGYTDLLAIQNAPLSPEMQAAEDKRKKQAAEYWGS